MFQIILDERKRREIDPTMKLLRECLDEAGCGRSNDQVRERLETMLGFFETMSGWYSQIRRLPQGAVIRFVKLGGKVGRMLGVA
jgi:DNA-binding transcriptional regulator GbsR (MarR family)